MLLLPYRSYGTASRLYLLGRVLDDEPLPPPSERGSTWQGLRAMWRRLETDEVAGAQLEVVYETQRGVLETNDEGYFKLEFTPATPLPPNDGWHQLELRLLNVPPPLTLPAGDPVKATAAVLVPPADAEFGIISDIDDTIVETGATSLPKMFRNTFLRPYRTRMPFAGVADFYKALQLGLNGKRNNPLFYVSSSPWNLYDLLDDYMKHHGLPAGPILLRDYGIGRHNLREFGDHLAHKLREITQVFDTYPALPFVLIGDSGQQDPEIYRQVVQRYPGRVRAIYIRDVDGAAEARARAALRRDEIVMTYAKELEVAGVPMLLVPDTATAAAHAATLGLVMPAQVPAVAAGAAADKANPE